MHQRHSSYVRHLLLMTAAALLTLYLREPLFDWFFVDQVQAQFARVDSANAIPLLQHPSLRCREVDLLPPGSLVEVQGRTELEASNDGVRLVQVKTVSGKKGWSPEVRLRMVPVPEALDERAQDRQRFLDKIRCAVRDSVAGFLGEQALSGFDLRYSIPPLESSQLAVQTEVDLDGSSVSEPLLFVVDLEVRLSNHSLVDSHVTVRRIEPQSSGDRRYFR